MNKTKFIGLSDRLNRLVKLALDTGEASSVEDAEKLFKGYKLAVTAGPEVGYSPSLQAALLTIVNTGRRSLLGGVEVKGIEDMNILLPVSPYQTLQEAVIGLGGCVVKTVSPRVPVVVLGEAATMIDAEFSIRATFDGWAAGILPLNQDWLRLEERREFIPSGVLAGALAVTEAFLFLRGNQPASGRREVGLSLWRPELHWRDDAATGPAIDRFPAALWLIGLGNLGQAYLWTLGLLPFAEPADVHLVMQDFDVLAKSNESTSLLTSGDMIGMHKTRAMAHWAERRGFKTTIVERRFGANFRVSADEPTLALCGVDNALARSALEDVGFGRVIEAGLGGGIQDFLGFRTHTFPGARNAHDLWVADPESPEHRLDLPGYKNLASNGLDRCGLTQLAGRTVGAPFVGAIAATLVVAEALRIANGAHCYDIVDAHLRDISHRTIVPAQELQPFNPGTTPCCSLGHGFLRSLKARCVERTYCS